MARLCRIREVWVFPADGRCEEAGVCGPSLEGKDPGTCSRSHLRLPGVLWGPRPGGAWSRGAGLPPPLPLDRPPAPAPVGSRMCPEALCLPGPRPGWELVGGPRVPLSPFRNSPSSVCRASWERVWGVIEGPGVPGAGDGLARCGLRRHARCWGHGGKPGSLQRSGGHGRHPHSREGPAGGPSGSKASPSVFRFCVFSCPPPPPPIHGLVLCGFSSSWSTVARKC